MTHAVEGGIYVTRCAIGFTFTRNRDVDDVFSTETGLERAGFSRPVC